MGKVWIQQFNPASGNWNTLYEVPWEKYDPNTPITADRYGGPYRVIKIGVVEDKKIVDFTKGNVIEEKELEYEELEDEWQLEQPKVFDIKSSL